MNQDQKEQRKEAENRKEEEELKNNKVALQEEIVKEGKKEHKRRKNAAIKGGRNTGRKEDRIKKEAEEGQRVINTGNRRQREGRNKKQTKAKQKRSEDLNRLQFSRPQFIIVTEYPAASNDATGRTHTGPQTDSWMKLILSVNMHIETTIQDAVVSRIVGSNTCSYLSHLYTCCRKDGLAALVTCRD
jgi:hypothetical protein